MKVRISRRAFVAGSASAVAGFAASPLRPVVSLAGMSPARSNEGMLPYYGLDPEYGTGAACDVPEDDKPAHCHGCNACHQHGMNTLCATQASANTHRAHTHCQCQVVELGSLPESTWNALFSDPRSDDGRVDRRWPWVAAILEPGKIYLPLTSR